MVSLSEAYVSREIRIHEDSYWKTGYTDFCSIPACAIHQNLKMLPCCVSKHILKIRVASKLLKGFFPTLVLNFLISCSPESQILLDLKFFPYLKSFLCLKSFSNVKSFKNLNLPYFDHFHMILQWLGRKKEISYSLKGLMVWWFKEWKFECLVSRSKTEDPSRKHVGNDGKKAPWANEITRRSQCLALFLMYVLFCIHMGYSVLFTIKIIWLVKFFTNS